MDILEILKTNSTELLPEDLELLRTELAVGDYSAEYQRDCLDRIAQIEKWMQPDVPHTTAKQGTASVQVEPSALTPESQTRSKIPFLQQFQADLNAMRLSDKYRSSFRAYIRSHAELTEKFIDAHFSLFERWEIEAILSELPLSEAFLEKYFSVLDKDKIARYQQFSEKFYQKHFMDLDAETVLKKGKNEWRKKENRSSQFAVFLRLKGVQY